MRKPVPRWFVYNSQHEIYDGPYRTYHMAMKCAHFYRLKYHQDPIVDQELTSPDKPVGPIKQLVSLDGEVMVRF